MRTTRSVRLRVTGRAALAADATGKSVLAGFIPACECERERRVWPNVRRRARRAHVRKWDVIRLHECRAPYQVRIREREGISRSDGAKWFSHALRQPAISLVPGCRGRGRRRLHRRFRRKRVLAYHPTLHIVRQLRPP